MIETEALNFLSTTELSDNARDTYMYFLRNFFEYWYEQYPDKDPKNANLSHVTGWFKSHPQWSNATKYSASAALKKFFRFKYGGKHPICQLRIKRLDPGVQRTLQKNELMDILASIDTTTIKGIRDLAIISLMVDTGLRASELCNLELERLDLANQSLTVIVKGGEWAEKLFFDYSTNCLYNWLNIRDEIAKPFVKTVFVSVGGKKVGTKMTISALRYLSNKLSKATGLRHFSPHAFRRTFATLATENGAPSRVVQVAGGWKSIRMVERYTKALKKEAIKPFSPIDKLMMGE
jgi:integrase